jgi:hypothetical protein
MKRAAIFFATIFVAWGSITAVSPPPAQASWDGGGGGQVSPSELCRQVYNGYIYYWAGGGWYHQYLCLGGAAYYTGLVR